VDDETLEIAEGERIFTAATQPKAFMPLLDADHLLTSRRSAERALRTLIDWFDATLSPAAHSRGATTRISHHLERQRRWRCRQPLCGKEPNDVPVDTGNSASEEPGNE
jgi:hypothetical protein